jgi:hypothetical protein
MRNLTKQTTGAPAVAPSSPLSFDEFWRDPIPSTTPRTDAAKKNYIEQALPITNIFDPMAEMEREITALKKRITLADATVVACHSAMLGKVNPKHPAWGCVYAYEDQANNLDGTSSRCIRIRRFQP